MDIADLIPDKGQRRELYCDSCKASMDLIFESFAETLLGVRIAIANLPYLGCPVCGARYLTENSAFAIVELHRQATEKGSNGVQVVRNKKQADFSFTEVPFLVDADDYYYIPGLYRSFDMGFLTPLFFNRTVLSKFDTLPGYHVRFASQSYGSIEMADDMIAFGINRHGKLVMWLGDVAKLPLAEQYYLRSENVPSDHSIGSEFYDGQISCIFTEPPAEAILLQARSSLAKAFEIAFGRPLFHLDDQLVDTIARLAPPVVDTEKERRHVFDSLNRIFVESLDNAGLEKLVKALNLTPASTGSLKRLQSIFETKIDKATVGAALSPYFVTYDLRIAYSHLTSARKRAELLDSSAARLGLARGAALDAVYAALVAQLTASTEKLAGLIQ